MKRKTLVIATLVIGLLCASSVGLALLTASSFGGQDVSLATCRPRNLVRTDTCWGRNESWQECRFYYAATGAPNNSFCSTLVSRRREDAAASGPCELASPLGWAEVDCAAYGLETWSRCFACNRSKHEAAHAYVYGYDETCTSSIQLVSCNVAPRLAARLLRASRPGH